MALHRVHQQILRSHHLFEPLNEEQMEELMSSSHLLNIDKGRLQGLSATRLLN